MAHIALNQLGAHLQKGLRSLYTLHGDEALLQQEALDAIRERSVRGAAAGGLPLTTVIVSQRVSTVRDADMI